MRTRLFCFLMALGMMGACRSTSPSTVTPKATPKKTASPKVTNSPAGTVNPQPTATATVPTNPVATAQPTATPTASGTVQPTPTPTASGTVQTNPVASNTTTASNTVAVEPRAPARINLALSAQASNSWTVWPPLQRPRAGLVAAAIKGVLVAAEGDARSSVEQLDLTATGRRAWALRVPPVAVDGDSFGIRYAAGAANADYLYSLGGLIVGPSQLIVRYGQTENNAVLRDYTSFFTDRAWAQAACMQERQIHVFGGETQTQVLATTRKLDLDAKVLTPLTPCPAGKFAGAACVRVGSTAWVLGGYSKNLTQNVVAQTTVRKYDINGDTWRYSGDGQAAAPPALPQSRHSAAAALLNGTIYLAGGLDGNGLVMDSVLALNTQVASPTWTVVTSLPTARANLSLVAVEDRLVAIGGRDASGTPLAKVEVYRP
ncbi:MAG: hypothetical protein VKP62_06160 [Candidatus Sericytochromatia bacterium]|nr:hypothetical protein [Candidatus Sericytochromatia bacterium]